MKAWFLCFPLSQPTGDNGPKKWLSTHTPQGCWDTVQHLNTIACCVTITQQICSCWHTVVAEGQGDFCIFKVVFRQLPSILDLAINWQQLLMTILKLSFGWRDHREWRRNILRAYRNQTNSASTSACKSKWRIFCLINHVSIVFAQAQCHTTFLLQQISHACLTWK